MRPQPAFASPTWRATLLRRGYHAGDGFMRRALIGLGLGVLGSAIALGWGATDQGEAAEAATYDWRLAASPTPARDDIAIIEINESTMRAMAPIVGRWPWPRLMHAAVINYLARARARVIVYDVLFAEADTQGRYQIGDRLVTGPDSDADLVAAVRRAGNVVLLADAVFQEMQNPKAQTSEPRSDVSWPGATYAPGPGLLSRPDVHTPFAALRDSAAALGHNFLEKDPGGVSRAMYPFIESKGLVVPSLGMAAVLVANQVPAADVRLTGRNLRVADATLPLRAQTDLLLKLHDRFARETGETTFPTYSFFDVLLSEERVLTGGTPAIPESAFAGKIVFVGTSASGMADVHATAFGGNTPGMYLQATLADNVLSNTFMRRTSTFVDVGLTMAAGLMAGLAALTLPVWWALAGIGAVAVAGVTLATRGVAAGVWAPIVAPMVAAVTTLVAGLAWQYFVEGREKRHVKRLFGRYVSPDIFHQLMTNPSAVRMGGERREMSVLFSDIRGFTAASESATPEAVVEQLNEYFSGMVDVLFRHQGTLDKFVGDMVMGLFGAPVANPNHADDAVAAALEMMERLDGLNARWAASGRARLDIGIGINSGEMIAGNIGSESIMSYTVIGDAVNLGARIESLNKDYGTQILISEATRVRLTRPVATRRVAEVQVKGRREPVVVYEVMSRPGTGGDT